MGSTPTVPPNLKHWIRPWSYALIKGAHPTFLPEGPVVSLAATDLKNTYLEPRWKNWPYVLVYLNIAFLRHASTEI